MSENCPPGYKIGGIFGVAVIAYYVGRWLGLRSRVSKKATDEPTVINDGDLQPEL